MTIIDSKTGNKLNIEVTESASETTSKVKFTNFVISGDKAANYEISTENVECVMSNDNIVTVLITSDNGKVTAYRRIESVNIRISRNLFVSVRKICPSLCADGFRGILVCGAPCSGKTTFLRSFGAICGCTPMQYITRYRCRRARELLASGEYSKTEIAVMCGFYDLSHMERVMRGQR